MSCGRATWKNALLATVPADTFWLSAWVWSERRLSLCPSPGCLPRSGCSRTPMRGVRWRERSLPRTRTAAAAESRSSFRYTTRCRSPISSPTVRTRTTLTSARSCAPGATDGRSLQHSRARTLSCFFKDRTARRVSGLIARSPETEPKIAPRPPRVPGAGFWVGWVAPGWACWLFVFGWCSGVSGVFWQPEGGPGCCWLSGYGLPGGGGAAWVAALGSPIGMPVVVAALAAGAALAVWGHWRGRCR